MTRPLQPHHLEIEIARRFDTYPEDNLDGWGELEDAKRPFFQKGDLIACDTAHGPRRALVIFTSRTRSDFCGDYIPLYKVRLCKADGTLGMAWRWLFPGDIERGLAALAAEVAA